MTEEYRHFEGQYTLLVLCSWRLDGPSYSVASSDQAPGTIATKLRDALTGLHVVAAEARGRANDLRLEFERGLVLNVFCDRLPEDSIDCDNWQLEAEDGIIAVGPGYRVSTEIRHPG